MTVGQVLTGAVVAAAAWQHLRTQRTLTRQRARLRQELVERSHALAETNVQLQQELTQRHHVEASLRDSEAQFRGMVETSPLAIYVSVGLDQRAVYVNTTFVRFFGYTIEEIPTASDWWPLAYPDEDSRTRVATEWRRRIKDALATGSQIEPMETVVTCKDGSQRNIIWGFKPIGERSWTFGLDVTDLRSREAALRASEEKYRVVFDSSPDAFLILTRTGEPVFVDCNNATQRMLRGEREQIVGQTPWALSPPTQFDGRSSEKAARTILTELSPHDSSSFEWVHRRFDGTDVVVEVSLAPIAWEGELASFITWRDVTERRRQQQELQERATTDALTGVVNRRQFLHLTRGEIRRTRRLGHPLTVAVLDLDGFKDVNDSYGHGVGDQALLAFTETCRETIREIDTLGRLGGDEFVLLLPETSVDGAHPLLERLRRAVEDRLMALDGIPLHLTVSSGVAGWRGEGDSLDELVERADQALYAAKQAGRNRTVAADRV